MTKKEILKHVDNLCVREVKPSQITPHLLDELKQNKNLVDAVLEGFDVLDINVERKNMEDIRVADDLNIRIDPDKELKDIMTDFTTNEFFKKQEMMSRFVKLIVDSFDNALTYYKKRRHLKKDDIFFIYKGGNIMRSLYMKYLYEVPGIASDELHRTFDQFFKHSDSDFQIYINPQLARNTWDKIYKEMISLSYLIMNRIRMFYLLEPQYFFDYYQLKEPLQEKIVRAKLDELNASKLTKDKSIISNPLTEKIKPLYRAKFIGLRYSDIDVWKSHKDFETVKNISNDKIVDFPHYKEKFIKYKNNSFRKDVIAATYFQDNEKLRAIFAQPYLSERNLSSKIREILRFDIDLEKKLLQKRGTEFFISVNDNVEYQGDQNFNVRFSLVRMKVNFTSFFVTHDGKYGLYHIPGELIDVSISHRDSMDMDIFFDNPQEHQTLYKFHSYQPDIESFYFNSYTPMYYIHDLEKILFQEHLFPWADIKYSKRIYRIGFLYLMEMMLVIGPNLSYDLIAEFKRILTESLKIKDASGFNLFIRKALKKSKIYQIANDEDLQIYFLILKIVQFAGGKPKSDLRIIQNPLTKNVLKDNYVNIRQFIETIIDLTDNLLIFIKLFNNYLAKQGQLPRSRLYSIHEF